MADQKLPALSALTAPTDDDLMYIVDAPGTTPASKKITWANIKAALRGYVLYGQCEQFNPADATTYYVGSRWGTAPTSVDGAQPITIPKTGIVTRVDIAFSMQTAFGTTETSTVYFRLNSTTDTTLSAAVNNAGNQVIHATGLSIAVTVGDLFEIKWVTPTWATNPQGMTIVAQVFVD